MEINFTIDEIHYHGIAVPFEKPGSAEPHYLIRLEDKDLIVFNIHKSEKGEWSSDDMQNADLISAAGREIEKRDAGGEVIVDGEVINEPDDVDEQTV